MKEEFDKLSAALIKGAATCSPPLPLTTIVVQVMFSLLQNYDLCARFPLYVLCNLDRRFFTTLFLLLFCL
jgi:hypothetical protein